MALSLFQSPLYDRQFGDAELAVLLSDARDVDRMVRFERYLARVQGQLGVIPAEAGEGLFQGLKGVSVAPEDLAEGVASSGVAVPALVAALRKAVPAAHGQWLHWGATSQDVIDSAIVLAVQDALHVIEARLGGLIETLATRSSRFDATVMAGRTRGQIATPITFGLRIAQWARPLISLEAELDPMRKAALCVQFGGASGANTAIAPHGHAIAEALAAALGLSASTPWHTDRTGLLLAGGWLQRLSIALSKLAGDLILMMRSEIAEAKAGAGGGSSTMPQKSNPVVPETIQVLGTLANAAHSGLSASAIHAEERDGAAWPTEWTLLPQMLMAAGAALRHAQVLADSLEANSEQMSATLQKTTGVMAEHASFVLAAHMPRAGAQALVKAAVATGKPLASGLAEVSDLDIDWDATLDPATCIPACKDTAARIFAARS